jgi:nitrogen fixation/metabolism regulation signal transduction histidine kinase
MSLKEQAETTALIWAFNSHTDGRTANAAEMGHWDLGQYCRARAELRLEPVFNISVADTGPGIPEQERTRIFEHFHQVDSSNTKAKGGTGLGLAIAKQIVKMLVVGSGSNRRWARARHSRWRFPTRSATT